MKPHHHPAPRSCRCHAVAAFRSCRRKTVAAGSLIRALASAPTFRALAGAATVLLSLLPPGLRAQTANEPPPFLRTGPSLTQAPEGATPFVKNRWIDRNGDGWDDIWCLISAMPAPNDKTKDTDGDTVSDYDEMLHWRDPRVKGPPLGWPNYTVEELLQAQIAAAAMRRTNEARMAQRRQELRRHMGREIGVDHVTGRGLSLAEIEVRRMQKFRTRVNHERPLKAARMEQARQYLRRHGLPEVIEGADGSVSVFANERNGKPVYYGTQNTGAGETISVDELNAATPAGLGLNLTGAGVNIGHFDTGNALFAHPEFAPFASSTDPRIVDMEVKLNIFNPSGTLAENRHSTHTAGTIIAKGISGYANAKGLASGSVLESFNYLDDGTKLNLVMTNSDGTDDFPVSNHSYGTQIGWEIAPNGVAWYGYGDTSGPTLFWTDQGTYTEESCALDQFVEEAIYTLPVFAAGNDRDDAAPTSGSFYMVKQGVTCTLGQFGWNPYDPPVSEAAEYGGYFTIRPQACARNVLTVGSCAKISGGFSGPGSVTVSAYSNWGPTWGNVMKPDVIAPGEGLYSAWISGSGTADYTTESGTSMAAPTIAAQIALLVEHYQGFYGSSARLWASTLKGLIIHTADDVDSDNNLATHPDGPDYRGGNGLPNARRGAELVTADGQNGNHPFIKQVLAYVSYDELPQYFEMPVISAGGPMRLTVTFSDVAGPPDPGDPNDTECYGDGQMLCDAWVIHPNNTESYPWTLNWAFPEEPATQEHLSVDNVQVFDLPSTTAGAIYTLRLGPYPHNPNVQGTSWGVGVLPVSIIISGAQAPPEVEFKITHFERVSESPHVYSIEWPTIPGHFYRLETSTDLINWVRAKKPVGAGVEIADLSPAGNVTTAEILAEPSNTRQFWRVKKLQPWDVSP